MHLANHRNNVYSEPGDLGPPNVSVGPSNKRKTMIEFGNFWAILCLSWIIFSETNYHYPDKFLF